MSRKGQPRMLASVETAALTRGRGGPRTTLRTIVRPGLLALGVIVWLLTMCSLDAHGASTTHAAPAQTFSTVAGHSTFDASAGHPTVPLTGACDDCSTTGDGGHLGLAMACGMALLTFLALLPLPGRPRFRIIDAVRAGPRVVLRSLVHWARPSLHVLCISRT